MIGTTSRADAVRVSLGNAPADVVISGGTVVHVHTGELLEADVAISGDRIAAVGDVDYAVGDETEIVDASDRYVCPGLIEGHLHSYHSYINGTEFSKQLLEHGTTTYADGFYGQAIVSGMRSIRFLKDEIQRTPLTLIFLAPALAYQQLTTADVPPTPERLTDEDMRTMLGWEDCHGLEEPTYVPIADLDEEMIELFEETLRRRKVVTGHAANPTREQLSAFIAAGASTDHETSTRAGAIERARNGMANLMRYGTDLPDLVELTRALHGRPIDDRTFGFSSDVIHPAELSADGCIDENVRAAVRHGIDPVSAIQMATINTATALRIDQEVGSIAPGKIADVVVLSDLATFDIDTVISNGDVVWNDGAFRVAFEMPDYPKWMRCTVDLGGPVEDSDFEVPRRGRERVTVTTIKLPAGGGREHAQRRTVRGRRTVPVRNGVVQNDVDGAVVKAAMVDRHEASGRIGLGFVERFGITGGALAISANAVQQNVAVVGATDEAMRVAVNRIDELQGGAVVALDGEVRAEVPLPLFGLQSDRRTETVIDQFTELESCIERDLGYDGGNALFDLESLVTPSPETPGLRLSDRGLVDIENREWVDLFPGN